MKKKIKDITFKEFCGYCNARACDGRWSLSDALNCVTAVKLIMSVRPLFGRKKAREKEWEIIKNRHFNLDAEVELD